MPIKTVTVMGQFYAPDGTPLADCQVTVTLTSVAVDPDSGITVPLVRKFVTDSVGAAAMDLWPNTLGDEPSEYFLEVFESTGKAHRLGRFMVPHVNSDGAPLLTVDLASLVANNIGWEAGQSILMQAQQAVSDATSQATASAAYASDALSAAGEAKRQADSAAEVVTGGTGSLAPAPGRIPVADAKGNIDPGWLGDHLVIPPFSEFEVEREKNRQSFVASGFSEWGKHYVNGGNTPINEGLWAIDSAADCLRVGTHVVSIGGITEGGTSLTKHPKMHIAGVVTDIISMNGPDGRTYSQIKFPAAESGKRVYDTATGESTEYATAGEAFAAETSTATVVTCRVDVFGMEWFLRKLYDRATDTWLGYAYPNGLIQSKATTWDGVDCADDVRRPDSFFAVFDGDATSRGLGVDVSLMTGEWKLSNCRKHHIFRMSNGDVVQWCGRQRTIAGAGNGEWANIIEPAVGTASLSWDKGPGEKLRVLPQGNKDSVTPLGNYGSDGDYLNSTHTDPQARVLAGSRGVFGARAPNAMARENIAVNGECYFHVWGSVSRLNQGGYHPSLNPFGSSRFSRSDGQSALMWFTAGQPSISTTAQCFNFGSGYPVNGGNLTEPTIYSQRGEIGGYSGRPDGRLFNAIYDSGLGGVVDYRLPAWDVSSKEIASEIVRKVVNGSYRGAEKLVFNINLGIDKTAYNESYGTLLSVQQKSGHDIIADDGGVIFHNGNAYSVSRYAANAYWFEIKKWGQESTVPQRGDYTALIDTSKPFVYVPGGRVHADRLVTSPPFNSSQYLAVTVSGNFTLSEIVGNPARAISVPQLSGGWFGNWGGVYGSGTQHVKAVRKSPESLGEGRLAWSDTLGSTWSESMVGSLTATWSNVANLLWGSGWSEDRVAIFTYTAFAKQTRPSVNAKVLHGRDGLGDVWQYGGFYAPHWGSLFAESLLNKVGTANVSGAGGNFVMLTEITIRPDTAMLSTGVAVDRTSHHPINKPAPGVVTPGVKALWYQTGQEGQINLQFAWTELAHDGTDWGDNGTVLVGDGVYTQTNLNGATCLAGTSELSIPYGYTKEL